MDPRDGLRPLLDGVGCTACGVTVPAGRIRLLAHRDDLAFVELDCPGCASTTLGLLLASDDGAGGHVLDVAPFGELSPDDEARRAASGPISAADVRAARDFLAGWRGDLVGLLGRR
ncbi:MAG TPA: hypothetical protein VLA44_05360 [Clostridia bacterium]|nr:hypothetical protein [Clostridia bacterium]